MKCQTCFIDFIASTLTLLQRLLVLWRQWLMRILGVLQKPITLDKKFDLAFLSFWKVWNLFWAAVAANEEFGKTDTTSVAVSAVHSIRAAKTKSCSNKPQGILRFSRPKHFSKAFQEPHLSKNGKPWINHSYENVDSGEKPLLNLYLDWNIWDEMSEQWAYLVSRRF